MFGRLAATFRVNIKKLIRKTTFGPANVFALVAVDRAYDVLRRVVIVLDADDDVPGDKEHDEQRRRHCLIMNVDKFERHDVKRSFKCLLLN